MTSRCFIFTALSATVVTALAANRASAATIPTTFAFDTVNSAINITLSLGLIPLGSGTALGSGGALTADVEQTGTAPPAQSLSNVQGSFDVIDFSTSGGLLSLSLNSVVFDVGPSAGPFLTNNLNPGQVDLEGLEVGIVAGQVEVGGSTQYDFGTNPLYFQMGSGVFGTINETGGPTSYDVRLGIPIDFAGSVEISSGTLNYDLNGTIFYDGAINVPEPGTFALAGVALWALIAVGCRVRRKK